MTEWKSSDAPPLVDPHTGGIAVDCACYSCGYNLRCLAPDGRCPECAAWIEQSVSWHDPRCADAPWLDALHSSVQFVSDALGLVAISVCVMMVAVLLASVSDLYFSALFGSAGVRALFGLLAVFVTPVAPVALLVALIGLHGTARRPPHPGCPRKVQACRLRARRAAAMFWCSLPVGLLASLLTLQPAVAIACAAVAAAALLVWLSAHAGYLGALAQAWGWTRVRAAGRSFVLALAATGSFGVLLLTTSLGTRAGAMPILNGVSILFVAGCLVSALAALLLGVRLHSRFCAALVASLAKDAPRASAPATADAPTPVAAPARTDAADGS